MVANYSAALTPNLRATSRVSLGFNAFALTRQLVVVRSSSSHELHVLPEPSPSSTGTHYDSAASSHGDFPATWRSYLGSLHQIVEHSSVPSPLQIEALLVERALRSHTTLDPAASHGKTVDKLHRLRQALRSFFPGVPA